MRLPTDTSKICRGAYEGHADAGKRDTAGETSTVSLRLQFNGCEQRQKMAA